MHIWLPIRGYHYIRINAQNWWFSVYKNVCSFLVQKPVSGCNFQHLHTAISVPSAGIFKLGPLQSNLLRDINSCEIRAPNRSSEVIFYKDNLDAKYSLILDSILNNKLTKERIARVLGIQKNIAAFDVRAEFFLHRIMRTQFCLVRRLYANFLLLNSTQTYWNTF